MPNLMACIKSFRPSLVKFKTTFFFVKHKFESVSIGMCFEKVGLNFLPI